MFSPDFLLQEVFFFFFPFFSFLERTIPSTGYGCILRILEKGLECFMVEKKKNNQPTSHKFTVSAEGV